MYTLKIQGLHWSAVKNSCLILSCLFLFGCSSSHQIQTKKLSENVLFKEYKEEAINDKSDYFYATHVSLIKNSAKQSPQYSDHQLMMSLLNRPITSDQAMMIAIEKERVNYNYSLSEYGIAIKGDKNDDKTYYRANNRYTDLILQDINSVNITAPN